MLHRPIAAVCAALLACACSAQAPAKKGQPHVKKQSYGKMPMALRWICTCSPTRTAWKRPDRVRRHAGIADGARPSTARSPTWCWAWTRSTAAAPKPPGSAPSSAAMATASPAGSSRSRVSPTICPSTMAPNAPRRPARIRQAVCGRCGKLASAEGPAVEFSYVSKDGEEGFPGNAYHQGGLHADEQERTEDRLHRDHG